MTDKISGVEIAGPENDGQTFTAMENAGQHLQTEMKQLTFVDCESRHKSTNTTQERGAFKQTSQISAGVVVLSMGNTVSDPLIVLIAYPHCDQHGECRELRSTLQLLDNMDIDNTDDDLQQTSTSTMTSDQQTTKPAETCDVCLSAPRSGVALVPL